jgi:hypothetical protein
MIGCLALDRLKRRSMSRAAALALALIVAAPALGAAGEAERVLERRVKAAFLFRFTEFVGWPDSAFSRPADPFTIAVVGGETLANELRQITSGKTVHGRAVEVRRVADGEAIPSAQIVFLGDADMQRLRERLRRSPPHALVVSESEGALTAGSVINFVIVNDRVRFEISLAEAARRGLRMSSRLLAVAQDVKTGTP